MKQYFRTLLLFAVEKLYRTSLRFSYAVDRLHKRVFELYIRVTCPESLKASLYPNIVPQGELNVYLDESGNYQFTYSHKRSGLDDEQSDVIYHHKDEKWEKFEKKLDKSSTRKKSPKRKKATTKKARINKKRSKK